MLTLSKCKAKWQRRPKTIKLPFLCLGLSLSLFFISPAIFDPFFISGYEDKLFHLLFFGILAYTFGKQNSVNLFIVFILGLTIEGVQSIVPNRSACIYDLLANISGIIFGSFFSFFQAFEISSIQSKKP